MALYAVCRLKNNTLVDLIIRGQVIAPDAYYTVQDTEREWWASDETIVTKITAGDLVVNDGTSDLYAANGIELFRLNFSANAVRIQNTKIDTSVIDHDYILTFKKNNPSGDFDPYNDKFILKKLAALGNSGRAIEISFVSPNAPYLTSVSNSYSTYGYVIFPGTGNAGFPGEVNIVAWSAAAGSNSDYRLYDYTNAITLAEKIGVIDGSPMIQILDLVNPFSLGPAILAIQGRKGSSPSASAILASLEIFF